MTLSHGKSEDVRPAALPSRGKRPAMVLATSHGFSLLEMMLVVGVIGIVALMSGFNMNTISAKSSFNTDITTVQDVLWRARNWARNRNQCARVAVSGQKLIVSGFAQANCAAAPGPLTVVYEATLSDIAQVVGDFTPSSPFVFNQTGGTIYSQPGTLTLKNVVTNTQTVFTIYPIIGQVRVR